MVSNGIMILVVLFFFFQVRDCTLGQRLVCVCGADCEWKGHESEYVASRERERE